MDGGKPNGGACSPPFALSSNAQQAARQLEPHTRDKTPEITHPSRPTKNGIFISGDGVADIPARSNLRFNMAADKIPHAQWTQPASGSPSTRAISRKF
jgi:hypothetical protein